MVAEIHARRLGSPLDSMLTLTDADGNEIAFNDDHKDMSQAMLTHHADSHLTASIPAEGNYYLHVTDAQRNGGPDFSYRLCMRAPQAGLRTSCCPLEYHRSRRTGRSDHRVRACAKMVLTKTSS